MANQRLLTRIKQWLCKAMPSSRYVLNILLVLFFSLSGCATPTTFRVLDAETKEPIEGAVALAMWNRTTGLPGLSSTYTAKAIEVETDAEGVFQIPIIVGTFAMQTPRLKVYKPGYVGWDSIWIYLGCYEENRTVPRLQRREGFSMKNQDIYLEPWKKEYSFMSHYSFIQVLANLRKEAGLKDSEYEKAIEFEMPLYIKEDKARRKKRK